MLIRFMCSLTLLAAAAGSATAAGGDAVGPIETDSKVISVGGSGHQRTFPCNGRKVIVDGTDHVITLTGVCSGLELSGGDNTVSITLAPNGLLEVSGTGHKVKWASSGEPRQAIYGVDNKINRVKALP